MRYNLGDTGQFTHWFEFRNAMNPTQLSPEREIEIKETGPGFAALGAVLAIVAAVLLRRTERGG